MREFDLKDLSRIRKFIRYKTARKRIDARSKELGKIIAEHEEHIYELMLQAGVQSFTIDRENRKITDKGYLAALIKTVFEDYSVRVVKRDHFAQIIEELIDNRVIEIEDERSTISTGSMIWAGAVKKDPKEETNSTHSRVCSILKKIGLGMYASERFDSKKLSKYFRDLNKEEREVGSPVESLLEPTLRGVIKLTEKKNISVSHR